MKRSHVSPQPEVIDLTDDSESPPPKVLKTGRDAAPATAFRARQPPGRSPAASRQASGRYFHPLRPNSREERPGPAGQFRDSVNPWASFPGPDVFSHPSARFRSLLNPDPDHFTGVAEELARGLPPCRIGGKFSTLSESVIARFNASRQSLNITKQKIRLWKEVYRVVRHEFDCGLFVFGSTFNGFGLEESDMDMCLLVQGGPAVSERQHLEKVRRLLQRHGGATFRPNIELVPAKVPILKFREKTGGLEVDLCVNNPTSVRNTHLLFYYCKCDVRLRPLVLAVKLWARKHGINEARLQTLSSYTLSLMVIHYLQAGISPPVLPCLQQMYPDIFHPQSNIFCLNFMDQPAFSSENVQPVGELLVGFFKYYAKDCVFNTERDVASVRTGQVLSVHQCEQFARQYKISPGQWRAKLLVEEPFERTNAARAVCSEPMWQLIRRAFQRTAAHLEQCDLSKLKLEDLLALQIDQQRSVGGSS